MDSAKQHWPILGKLGTDLAKKVRSFMVIGKDGEGLIVATEDGQGFWFGTMKFGSSETRIAIEPTSLNVPNELVQMAQSDNHILLLNKRGEIYSMGQNEHGELGLGTATKETHFTPQLIPSPHKFISVRCGKWHSLALTEDGKVWGWGWNRLCQLGRLSNSTFSVSSPHQIVGLDPHRVVSIEVGGCHSMALTDQGEFYTWGWNQSGQLGDGSETSKDTPTRIPTSSPVQSIAAGYNHTLVLTQTGEVYVCGDNEWCQLAVYTRIESSPRLVKVNGLPFISKIASHPASHMSIAMSHDQQCFVWGKLANENLEKKFISLSTILNLPSFYSTVESPLSFFSLHRSTPHSIQLQETPPSRLSTKMSRMFDNPKTGDVQFVVEQRTIHAHRNILKYSSDYFARMFSERWLSPVDPEDPIVKVTIPDYSYQAFHSFLRFLYTECLEVHPDILPELFELATLYLVPDLHQLCILRMRETLTPTTCCLYYPLTHRHSLLPELATFQPELVQFASTRMSEVVHSAAYHSMQPDLRDQLTNAVQYFPDT